VRRGVREARRDERVDRRSRNATQTAQLERHKVATGNEREDHGSSAAEGLSRLCRVEKTIHVRSSGLAMRSCQPLRVRDVVSMLRLMVEINKMAGRQRDEVIRASSATLTPNDRRHRQRLPRRVEDKIRELSNEGDLDPKAIHSLVHDQFPGEAVSLRTVQRRVQESRARFGPSAIWTLTPDQGDAARVVLGCLAAVVRVTGNPNRGITVRTADWIAAVARVAPDLPPWSTYRLARWYEGRTSTNDSTDDLDLYLAMRPWRSIRAREAYEAILASRPMDSDGTFDTDDVFEWPIVERWVDARAWLEVARERGLRAVRRKMRRRLARLPVPGYTIEGLRSMVDQRKTNVRESLESSPVAERPATTGPGISPDAS
jgi:hypothetical protein